MKKILVFMAITAAFYAVAAQWTMTLTGNTRCIPKRNVTVSESTQWTNSISVAVGNYYYNTDNRIFFALSSGTSTNEPATTMTKDSIKGTYSGGDGLEWIYVSSYFGDDGVLAVVLEGSEAHFNRNAPATNTCPWMVYSTFDSKAAWYFAPTNSGTTTISFMEK